MNTHQFCFVFVSSPFFFFEYRPLIFCRWKTAIRKYREKKNKGITTAKLKERKKKRHATTNLAHTRLKIMFVFPFMCKKKKEKNLHLHIYIYIYIGVFFF